MLVACQIQPVKEAEVNEPVIQEEVVEEIKQEVQDRITNTETEKKEMPTKIKVVFFGDQGVTENSRKVLELVRREQTDIIIHLGDLGYNEEDDLTPQKWSSMHDEILGENFPIVSVIGNHDVKHWKEYEADLKQRIPFYFNCTGLYGIKMSCTYGNMLFIFSGVGTDHGGHEAYLKQELSKDAEWKLCLWHKNQHIMQLGGKTDEVGWDAYRLCREKGAMIINGHEHSYSRTYLMSLLEIPTVSSTELTLKPGKTFVTVSGVAGQSIRGENSKVKNQFWWAKKYTTVQEADYGGLFCTFEINKRTAECYFKNIQDEVIDQFTVTSEI